MGGPGGRERYVPKRLRHLRARVFLVDDSPGYLSAASDALSRDPRVSIVGAARSGVDAMRMMWQEISRARGLWPEGH